MPFRPFRIVSERKRFRRPFPKIRRQDFPTDVSRPSPKNACFRTNFLLPASTPLIFSGFLFLLRFARILPFLSVFTPLLSVFGPFSVRKLFLSPRSFHSNFSGPHFATLYYFPQRLRENGPARRRISARIFRPDRPLRGRVCLIAPSSESLFLFLFPPSYFRIFAPAPDRSLSPLSTRFFIRLEKNRQFYCQ